MVVIYIPVLTYYSKSKALITLGEEDDKEKSF